MLVAFLALPGARAQLSPVSGRAVSHSGAQWICEAETVHSALKRALSWAPRAGCVVA